MLGIQDVATRNELRKYGEETARFRELTERQCMGNAESG